MLSSQAANPALVALAGKYLEFAQAAGGIEFKIKRNNDELAVFNGTADEAQKRNAGAATSTNASAGAFDRLSKAMDRQSASMAAEAQTAGQSAGVAAKLRAEFVLTEAAQQSGIAVAGAYADKIKAIADRAGEAAQKLAVANLQSNTAFATSQLSRTAIDASVADQLKGAFGNDADQNSAIANTIRLDETLKDIKGTAQDLASGAFRDIRTELQNGATAFQAFGNAAVNAVNKIMDKLADKAIDAGLSKIIGALGGSVFGGNAGAGISVGKLGFAYGGFTGAGGKYQPAGIVHKGE